MFLLFPSPITCIHISINITGQALEEANVTWTSHNIGLPKNEQYDPDYVRLNPRCVVPTLVVNGNVTTDAENIIHYVNKNLIKDKPTVTSLYPTDDEEKKLVSHFVTLGESLFVGALSHGKVPGVEHGGTSINARTESKASIEATLKKHQVKIDMLQGLKEKYKDDRYLRRCYEEKARLVKLTLDAMSTEKNMQEIVNTTKEAFDELADQLVQGPYSDTTIKTVDGHGWLCGPTYTMADLIWGIIMFRLQSLRIGEDLLWKDHPIIKDYAKELFARDTFKIAVVEWMKLMKQKK